MAGLMARTGRHQQRYKDGFRLIAGCVPQHENGVCHGDLEVLMINSTSGPVFCFQRVAGKMMKLLSRLPHLEEAGVQGDLVIRDFIGCYEFKSKKLQDELNPEGWCRAAVFALLVKEEFESWPEQSTRRRSWLTVAEAMECCKYPWMREALGEGFSRWHADQVSRK